MEKFIQRQNSSEVKEGEGMPVIDEELRLITSRLKMVADKIADNDPRIQRGGQNSVVRELNLAPEDINKIEEDTIDLKAVQEDLHRELEEYYSTRTNQLEREVKQEVETALREVLPNALKGGGRELFILRSNGDIHPQILGGLNTEALSKLSRKKIEIMRKLYDQNMSEGDFISQLMNPIKEHILESQDSSPGSSDLNISELNDSMESTEFTDQELTDIIRNKLSYQDAELPPEQLEAMSRDAEGRATAKEYARYLSTLPEDTVAQIVPEIKNQMMAALEELDIPISPFGKSDSWIYWDLGKQEYYFEQNKGREAVEGDPYSYSPTLEKEKLNEIVDRHIGWEFYHAPIDAREQAFKSIQDPYYLARAFEVLQNDPKADGQLSSHEYAELGKILREYTRSK